ncbi:MAG: hypothetical protein CL600_01085 [Alteromonas sp.]|jgi:hypothetical protein|uniref:hypothetical protein n=1 Tax=unclassified Alteromonas TaxID=2614992 RepID=UPI000903F04C|nr:MULTISPECIES: hypothetical protein [unclassified Alteromonas]APE07123.1 hypothetical protein BM528_16180 [Alteromonas sp. RW2A1]AUC89740.1 hypothetical protein CW735_17425 [Alteromonas sp. MB-3u-76]MAI63470.1 hypothetical protein [Alteromonas sp.]
MQSVDRAIEESRAKKKAQIKKVLLAVLTLAVVVAIVILLIAVLPAPSSNSDNKHQGTGSSNASSDNISTEKAFSEAQRKALQKRLSETKAQVEAMSARVSYSKRFTKAAKKIENQLAEAFNAYADANYSHAESIVSEVESNTVALISAFELAYTELFEKALNAFNENDNATAFNLNRQALDINPQYKPAKTLQQRIDVFEQVQDAYEQARVGKIENDIVKQQTAYTEIVKLDPLREDASQALAAINEQQKTIQFNNLLAKAKRAIEKEQFTTASQFLSEAKTIDANSEALKLLSQQLDAKIANNNLTELENQVALFISADEWETVALLTNKGLKQFPTSPLLLESSKSAKHIVASHQQIDRFLSQPERLADDNIRNAANSTLANAEPYFDRSEKLRAKADVLEQTINDANTPKDVTITSDNDTYIKVLGVGIVGEVKRKTIQLKPGDYRIEGKRKGYRSTIKNIKVTPSSTNLSVHVVCTEKV